MEERKPVPWSVLAYFGGLVLFLIACAHRVPAGGGPREFAATIALAALVWFLFTAILALGVRWLAGASRIRFVTAFAWIFLGLGIVDTSTWILVRVLQSELFRSMVREVRGSMPAQIADAHRIDRDLFTFEYPSNWSIDPPGPDVDPQCIVSIDTANGGWFQVLAFHDREAPEEAIERILQSFRGQRIQDIREVEFDQWGGYEGRGKMLRGRAFWILPTTVRAFHSGVGKNSFLIVELSYDEDAKAEAPGFALIRRTFEFKKD